MTRDEFTKLEIGDYVQITQHGQNKGKIACVMEIRRNGLGYGGGGAYLMPYKCEITFAGPRRQKNGLYSFRHESLKYLGKIPNVPPKSDKVFYVGVMYAEEAVEWPTTNFTEVELKVIDKFLKELNKHASDKTIDCIAILDNDEKMDTIFTKEERREKGKCLSCKHFYLGKEELNAWCMYKNMRHIYTLKLSDEDRTLRHSQLKVKYEGQLVKILQNKNNPNWCPLS